MAQRSVWRCQGWQLVCVCSVVSLVVPTCPETGGVRTEQGEHQAPSSTILMLPSLPLPSCLSRDSLQAGKGRALDLCQRRRRGGARELFFFFSDADLLHLESSVHPAGGGGSLWIICSSEVRSALLCSHTGNFAAFISRVLFFFSLFTRNTIRKEGVPFAAPPVSGSRALTVNICMVEARVGGVIPVTKT